MPISYGFLEIETPPCNHSTILHSPIEAATTGASAAAADGEVAGGRVRVRRRPRRYIFDEFTAGHFKGITSLELSHHLNS